MLEGLKSGTWSLQSPMDGVGVLEQSPCRNSHVGWLEKLRKVGKVPRVLPKYGGYKEWHVPLGVWSLTSWFPRK